VKQSQAYSHCLQTQNKMTSRTIRLAARFSECDKGCLTALAHLSHQKKLQMANSATKQKHPLSEVTEQGNTASAGILAKVNTCTTCSSQDPAQAHMTMLQKLAAHSGNLALVPLVEKATLACSKELHAANVTVCPFSASSNTLPTIWAINNRCPAMAMAEPLGDLGMKCGKQAKKTGCLVKLIMLIAHWAIEVLVLWKEMLLIACLFFWMRLHDFTCCGSLTTLEATDDLDIGDARPSASPFHMELHSISTAPEAVTAIPTAEVVTPTRSKRGSEGPQQAQKTPQAADGTSV